MSALAQESQRGAEQQAMVRLFGMIGWALLAAALSQVVEIGGPWAAAVPWLLAYVLISAVLWMWARRGGSVWVGPVLLDPLLVLGIHFVSWSEDPTGPAYFALSQFLIAALFAMLFLDTRIFLASTLVGALCGQVILWFAHAALGGHIGEGLIFVLFALVGRYVILRFLSVADALARERVAIGSLERYFSPAVARRILDQGGAPEASSTEVTILFVDVRGFTAMSELLEPSEVVAFLNELHTRLVGKVFEYGGTLDKFMGDGALIYFGAPVAQADHATRGVRCALAMFDEVRQLNQERQTQGHPAIGLGIGVHTGEVLVGNIGPEQRREFTIIGDAVNVASRIEGLTKPLGTPVLVTEATRRKASSDLVWEAMPEMEIRGRSEPVRLWRPAEAE